jgi:hypothetical protein
MFARLHHREIPPVMLHNNLRQCIESNCETEAIKAQQNAESHCGWAESRDFLERGLDTVIHNADHFSVSILKFPPCGQGTGISNFGINFGAHNLTTSKMHRSIRRRRFMQ